MMNKKKIGVVLLVSIVFTIGLIGLVHASIANGDWLGDWFVEKNVNATISIKSPLGIFGNITSPTFVSFIISKIGSGSGDNASTIWSYVTRTLTNLDNIRASKIDNLDVLLSSRANQTSIDIIDTNVDAINEKIDTLDTNIDTMNVKIDTIDINVDAVDVKIDTIDINVDTILIDVTPLVSYVDANSAYFTKTTVGTFSASYPATNAYDNNDATFAQTNTAGTTITIIFTSASPIITTGGRFIVGTAGSATYTVGYISYSGSQVVLATLVNPSTGTLWEPTWDKRFGFAFYISGSAQPTYNARIYEVDWKLST